MIFTTDLTNYIVEYFDQKPKCTDVLKNGSISKLNTQKYQQTLAWLSSGYQWNHMETSAEIFFAPHKSAIEYQYSTGQYQIRAHGLNILL